MALGLGDGVGSTYGVNSPPIPKSAPYAKITTNTSTVPMTKYVDARSWTWIDGSIGTAGVAALAPRT